MEIEIKTSYDNFFLNPEGIILEFKTNEEITIICQDLKIEIGYYILGGNGKYCGYGITAFFLDHKIFTKTNEFDPKSLVLDFNNFWLDKYKEILKKYQTETELLKKIGNILKKNKNKEQEPPKILFINGLHGDEQYAKFVLDNLLTNWQFRDYITLPYNYISTQITNEQNRREVHFNLNRMDDVYSIIDYAKKMNNLLEAIPNYDIILDLHNSPMCKNLMLCSSPKEEHHQGLVPLYLKKRIQEDDLIIWRKTKQDTISEYCRNLGKLSFTIEINGMYNIEHNQEKLYKDIKSLASMIQTALELYEINRGNGDPDAEINQHPFVPLYTPENELCNIKLKSKKYLTIGTTFEGLEKEEVVESITTSSGKKIENLNLIEKVIVLSPEGNYTNEFEGSFRYYKE